jgi:hypothetical protein
VEVAEPNPVYCRDDRCQLFVVWGDREQIGAPLEFAGSTATVTASPRSGLVDRERVRVSGTADGARGRTVLVVQEVCFTKYSAHGCSDAVELGRATVHRDGTWGLVARVHAVLGDNDCRVPEDIFGSCRIAAQVLDAAGDPDITFGDALDWGAPAVEVEFAAP